ncbi:MAG: sigma-70 family RNA polymerase sigma factor [Chloroflexi bacterium]|nr:sigma-70 family RNA polymerase sigma factor [Chloroflexota bacterium]
MPRPDTLSDAELLERARQGDQDAFRVLYQRYARRVYGFLRAYTGDPELADELVNDVFLRVWKALPKYREQQQFLAWLFRIARNAAVDKFRRQKRRAWLGLDALLPGEDVDTTTPHPETAALTQEEYQRLDEALQQLPETYRTVLVLRFLEGLTTAEIAQVLGRSENAVRVLQHRALKALRTKLQNAT